MASEITPAQAARVARGDESDRAAAAPETIVVRGRTYVLAPGGIVQGWAMIEMAARAVDLTAEQLRSPGQTRDRTDARRALALALYRRGWGLARIARFLKRDRTTVRFSIRGGEYMAERPQRFPEFCKLLDAVEQAGREAGQ